MQYTLNNLTTAQVREIQLEQTVEYALGALLNPLHERRFYWGFVMHSHGDGDRVEIMGPKGLEEFPLNNNLYLEPNVIVIVDLDKSRLLAYSRKLSEDLRRELAREWGTRQ